MQYYNEGCMALAPFVHNGSFVHPVAMHLERGWGSIIGYPKADKDMHQVRAQYAHYWRVMCVLGSYSYLRTTAALSAERLSSL